MAASPGCYPNGSRPTCARSAGGAQAIGKINADTGCEWKHSFLSADGKKTFCLYEAPSADAVREAARRAGLPADTVTPLSATIRPEQFA